ncbi:MAG: hypothetical protein N0E59_23340 [Candidatus Thiodiazotropha taylori]|nr:hypothetical protein [Candidatus Thiodiazotropha taylori]MCW4286056.1 hypothetical protein [Candidatus Thiodiazotropha taylori]
MFERNIVQEINREGDIVFRYVSTTENPADVATRGTTVPKLQENSLWWYGPSWLTVAEQEWPNSASENNEQINAQYETELKKAKSVKETG